MTKLNHMTAITDIAHADIFPGRRLLWILSVTGWRLVELHSVRVDLQPAADHTHTHTLACRRVQSQMDPHAFTTAHT